MANAAIQRTDLSSTHHDDPAGSAQDPPGDRDPADLAPLGDVTPLCGEQEFTELLEDIVADHAPGVFAVVQVYGERADGWVAAWGITFEDRTEVISLNDELRLSLQAPEQAPPFYSTDEHVTAHLIWVTPRATTPPDDEAS